MDFDKAHRDKIGQQLTLRLGRAVKEREISVIEVPYVSKYILKHLPQVKTHEELIEFLKKVVWEWPFFEEILKLAKGEEIKTEEVEELAKVRKTLKENSQGDNEQTTQNLAKN